MDESLADESLAEALAALMLGRHCLDGVDLGSAFFRLGIGAPKTATRLDIAPSRMQAQIDAEDGPGSPGWSRGLRRYAETRARVLAPEASPDFHRFVGSLRVVLSDFYDRVRPPGTSSGPSILFVLKLAARLWKGPSQRLPITQKKDPALLLKRLDRCEAFLLALDDEG